MASITRNISVVVISLAAALGGLAGCGDGGVACTAIAIAGINVVVKDPSGALVCDAKVEIKQGTATETAMPVGPTNDCGYAGAYEKPGTFTVTVTKTGFKTATADVTVTKDECHVIPQKLVVQLMTQ